MMSFGEFLDEAEHTLIGQQYGVSNAKKAGDRRGGNRASLSPLSGKGISKPAKPSRGLQFMDIGLKCVGTPPYKKRSNVVGS